MVDYSADDEIIRIDVTEVLRKRNIRGGHHFFLFVIKSTSERKYVLIHVQIFAPCAAWLAEPSLLLGPLDGF